MCRHQTLYHDDNMGYVIRCMECENFQLGFGNVLITLNATDFTSFRNCINKVLELQLINCRVQDTNNTEMDAKSIFIPTPCEGLKLLLTKKELKELQAMLDTADTEWKSQQLIDLFKQV